MRGRSPGKTGAEIRVRGPRPRATRVTSLNPWELADV